MGLYLAVFCGSEEIDGVEVGAYDDFEFFRATVVDALEKGVAGSRFPTLIHHSDCDGEWTAEQAARLEAELDAIAHELVALPPLPLGDGWKAEVAMMCGVQPANLYDCFFDVDGEPLLERLTNLARLSHERRQPILFQ